MLRDIHLPRATFYQSWRAAFANVCPKVALDWAILGRGVLSLEAGEGLESTSFRLGVHPRRLQRMSMRLAEVDLPTLTRRGSAWLAREFAEWLAREMSEFA